ncbi:CDP-2,3-bis-(O-geranylgeranyl)-sn-glycerol synthase [Caldiplasma sukawensis]
MQSLIYEILGGLFFFAPALFANPLAVITGGHLVIDRGKNLRDGKRILGDGKTWSGYFGGSLLGAGVGFPFSLFGVYMFFGNFDHFKIITVLMSALSLAFGSLTGDLFGSFIKRRMGMKRGAKGNLLDMWPFVLMSFLFLLVFFRVVFFQIYGNFIDIIILLIITPLLHRGVNIIAYKMHRKDVPW